MLAGAGDDFQLGVEGFGGDGDVQIVGIVVDDDAQADGAFDAGLLENGVALGIALDDQSAFVE